MFHCYLRAVAVLAVTLALSFTIAGPSWGKTATERPGYQSQEMIENMAAFENWRRNIPDYEKRLYDRIKGINKRVVQTRGVVWVLLIVNLMILVGVVVAVRSGGIGSLGTGNTLPRGDRRDYRKLLARQKKIERSLEQVRHHISEHEEAFDRIPELLKILEKEAQSLDLEMKEDPEGDDRTA